MKAPPALLALLAIAAAPPPESGPPAWVSGQVAPSAIEVAAQRYRVRPGDTLSHVVLRTGAGADAIVQANALQPPYTLRPGQKLSIPAGRYHRVARGESGIAIARAYGIDWGEVASVNHLAGPFILREGDRLLLPSRRALAGRTLEQRAAAFKLDLDDLVTGSEPALAPAARPVAPVRSPAPKVTASEPIAEPETHFAGRFAWPLKGRILRPFGPLANGGRNDGINIKARTGATIAAAADGAVAYAATYPGFGQVVLIRHGNGWITLYGHAGALLVKRGQAVTRGQPIALVGSTGSVSEPQLHFEIREGRRPVNPIDWLP